MDIWKAPWYEGEKGGIDPKVSGISYIGVLSVAFKPDTFLICSINMYFSESHV